MKKLQITFERKFHKNQTYSFFKSRLEKRAFPSVPLCFFDNPGFCLIDLKTKDSKVKATDSSFVSNQEAEKSQKYILQKYQRSNQDTLIFQRPLVRDGEWVQSGDIVADCSTSLGGELCLGKNIYIAYMPWEGYNYEDAILISQRLVLEDVYTSIHIESYEVETRTTKYGKEEFTKQIPDIPQSDTQNLDERGIVKLGTSVHEGDILVGKVTPIQKKFVSPYEKLLYTILEKELLPVRDSSLRTPKGLKAKVLEIKILNFSDGILSSNFQKSRSFKLQSFDSGDPKIQQKKKEKLIFGTKILQNPFFWSPLNTSSNLRLSRFFSFSNNLKFQKNFFSPLSVQNPKVLVQFFQKKRKTQRNRTIEWFQNIETGKKEFFSSKQNFESSKFGRFLKVQSQKKSFSETVLSNSHLSEKVWHGRPFFSLSSVEKKFSNFSCLPKISSDFFGKVNQNLFQNQSSSSFQKKTKAQNFYLQKLFGKNKSETFEMQVQPFQRKGLFHFVNSKLCLENKYVSQIREENVKTLKIPQKIQVYLVEKRKIQVGDKMSGRHGNKGIVSQILPIPDMPFLPDGTPIDMILNPLGVPSRMNVGQIYECILGLASKYLQEYYRIQPFDEIYGPQASRSFTFSKLYEARRKTAQKWLFNPCSPGKIYIFDGQTGEPYENPVTVGVSYILKLVHLVDDKIHARSTGPYSLVTQQPLRGRSKYGGQRLGEMEVWAIEAYGAAFVLLEMLTIKSDDISGRMTLWSNILSNMPIYIGTPESFKVLVCELQALCLDIGLYRLNKKGFFTQIEHLMQLP